MPLALLAALPPIAWSAAAAPAAVDVSTTALMAAIRTIEGFDPPFAGQTPDPPADVALGRRLFSDKRLSRSGTLSCATCHQSAKAFADGRARPLDARGRELRRNAPSLLNVDANGAFTRTRRLFWDGRAGGLEEAILSVLENPLEFERTRESLSKELRSLPEYKISADDGVRALAAYVRSLAPARPSPYERLHRDWGALTTAQKRGLLLFVGKARCVSCHWNADFTSGEFVKSGVKPAPGIRDEGRFEATGQEADRGRFRMPSLRNVAVTAPYMHDGSLATLADVIDFYDRGGHGTGPDAKLFLTRREKKDLEAFLYALTSPPASGAPPPALAEAVAEEKVETPAAPPPPPVETPRRPWTRQPDYAGAGCAQRFSPETLVRDLAAGRFDAAEFSFLSQNVLADLLSYYRYRAYAKKGTDVCGELDYAAYADEKYSRGVYCREWYRDVVLWRAMTTRDPAFASVCRGADSPIPDRAKNELCAALEASLADPRAACAKLPRGVVSLPGIRSCETFLGALSGVGDVDCSHYARSLTGLERCLTVTRFQRAYAGRDARLCGDNEPCEVLMGRGPAVLDRLAARMKKSVCARVE